MALDKSEGVVKRQVYGSVREHRGFRPWLRSEDASGFHVTNHPAVVAPTIWGNSFAYDIWANLLSKTVTKCTAETLSVTVNTKNQISNAGFTYDAAGNLTNSGAGVMTYDAENRLVSAGGATYTYDGDGSRVKKSSGKLYWYGPDGQLISESDLAGTWTIEHLYFAGRRLAKRELLPVYSMRYHYSDHLGSASVITNSGGGITDESDYYPFGGERTITNLDPNQYKFTGKERDTETGLDYFGARYYGSNMGRFLSTDPLFFQKSMLTDPQRFNLYSYVRNNPLMFVDPKGKAIELTGNDEERRKKLASIQSKIGKAGEYLYDNLYKGKHYVGIYTNGPSGKGPAFESINGATKALSQIIRNEKVGSIEFAPEGSRVMGAGGSRVITAIGSVDIQANKGPGTTQFQGDGTIKSYILDPSQDPGQLPGSMMSNGAPAELDTGIVVWHELGHMLEIMLGRVGPQTNEGADSLENTIRRLDDPHAPVRMMHDPPPGER